MILARQRCVDPVPYKSCVSRSRIIVCVLLSGSGYLLLQGLLTAEANYFQLSYACMSPTLSNTVDYPTVANLTRIFRPCRFVMECRTAVCIAFVQFVRSVAPATSYGVAVAAFGQFHHWVNYVVVHSTNLAVAAKSCGDAFLAIGFPPIRYVLIQHAEGKFVKDAVAVACRTLVDLKIRVVILLASVSQMTEAALEWKGQESKERWVWITDNTLQKLDFKGDTPEVCANESFVAPLPRFSQQAGREPVCCHPSMRRRRPLRDAHSTGGCT